jgi:hypothetical protein
VEKIMANFERKQYSRDQRYVANEAREAGAEVVSIWWCSLARTHVERSRELSLELMASASFQLTRTKHSKSSLEMNASMRDPLGHV